MPQLSAICFSLFVVSALVQNANGKRGCASFGHACYGGHGKRSSSVQFVDEATGAGSGGQAVEPLAYPANLALMDRGGRSSSSTSMEAMPFLRPGLLDLLGPRGREQLAQQDKAAYGIDGTSLDQIEHDRFEKSVRFAVNAMLRQMLAKNRLALQRQHPDMAGYETISEPGQQHPPQHLMDAEQN